MQEITILIVTLTLMIYQFVFIYRIGKNYFSAIAILQARKSKDVMSELKDGGLKHLFGILPIPYLVDFPTNAKVDYFLKKRRENILYFYGVFFGLILLHASLHYSGIKVG